MPALRASSDGELLVVLGEGVGQPVQEPGTIARRDGTPRREGGLGARDRGVDVRGGRALYLGQNLLGRRLDDLQGHRVAGLGLGSQRRVPADVRLAQLGVEL